MTQKGRTINYSLLKGIDEVKIPPKEMLNESLQSEEKF